MFERMVAKTKSKPKVMQRDPETLKDPKYNNLISMRLSILVRNPETRNFIAWPLGEAAITFKSKSPEAVQITLAKLERFLQNGCK